MGEGQSKNRENLTSSSSSEEQPAKMTLFEKISADIADGNEGEMLDMQCKNQMEAPHLWQD